MIKEIPILFSTPMVQAILAGRKTITRRMSGLDILNEWPSAWVHDETKMFVDEKGRLTFNFWNSNDGRRINIPCPYGKAGDILWVREEHYQYGYWTEKKGVKTKTGRQKWMFIPLTDEILFEAPESYRKGRHHKDPHTAAWHKRLARFMPKVAARIWLEVTDIRAERLHDINEEDAIAEGVQPAHCESNEGCPSILCKEKCCAIGDWWDYTNPSGEGFPASSAKESFETLWQSINGLESWNANPWIFVVTFKVLSTTGNPDNNI